MVFTFHRPETALRNAWTLVLACCVTLATAGGSAAAEATDRTARRAPLHDWPSLPPARARDAALEQRIDAILATMTLRDKVAQMTQGEIQQVTPEDVKRYRLGSVLNGGGSWPAGNDRHASVRDWLGLAQRYHDASLASGAPIPIPVIWGTDAVHGHNNVEGATLFPHNIGLGAARDPELLGEIGGAVGRAVRATGVRWVFAPTVAVAFDPRWGRTYESFSQDPALVEAYAHAYVAGLQGDLRGDDDVVATAKHYLADGGTLGGKDQGEARTTLDELVNVHARGYYGALGAGVGTVMVSLSSWTDAATGTAHGKMHGNRELLDVVLKHKLGFDGFVVTDWDGIGQLPGCSNAHCPAAINAGIDMVMAPNDWKAFIDNTVADVERGDIPASRIDDAVRRILRVKLRAGLFEQGPSASRYAGQDAALKADDLARRAVRESLVLLKNERRLLPLKHVRRLLVVGAAADSLPTQVGGWSVTWQGDQTTNADFPGAVTILAALRAAQAADEIVYSPDGSQFASGRFDAVVAVLGETPYAEFKGDVAAPAPLAHSARYPQDRDVLRTVAGHGVPVATVLLTGRPDYVTDLINLSDAFVVAWLPGSQGGGVTDVLLRDAAGKVGHDFRGRLPFAWPADPCRTDFVRPGASGRVLFPLGHGLTYSKPARVGRLVEAPEVDRCQ